MRSAARNLMITAALLVIATVMLVASYVLGIVVRAHRYPVGSIGRECLQRQVINSPRGTFLYLSKQVEGRGSLTCGSVMSVHLPKPGYEAYRPIDISSSAAGSPDRLEPENHGYKYEPTLEAAEEYLKGLPVKFHPQQVR